MATIVGVHGIWCDQATGPETQRIWTERLTAGLSENHCPNLDTVTIRTAYYGHLYNDGKGTEGIANDLPLDDFEQEFLEAMAAEAGVVPPGPGEKFGLPSPMQSLLRGLIRTPYFGAATTSAVLWLIHQVRRYFADPILRAAIHKEIEIAIQDDTRVVVAHSLGSVATYELLRAHPEWPARALVTVGSPLGLPGVIRRLADGTGWPGSTTAWTNIAAKEDPVAAVKRLKGVYDDRVIDLPARNTVVRGHNATQYLRNVGTARAIIDALSDERT